MSQTQSKRATLSSLPDELLVPIFRDSVKIEYIPVSKHSKIHSFKPCDSPTTTALILTCRRFRRLVTPLLYSELKIQCDGGCEDKFKDVWATRYLNRTFSTTPSLRAHCKRLEIEFGSSKQISRTYFDGQSSRTNLFRIAFNLLKWLTNIEELRIVGWPQFPDSWKFGLPVAAPTRNDYLQLLSLASDHLTSLRHLELATHSEAALDLPVLSAAFGGVLHPSACLRTLDISGISSFGTEHDWELLRSLAGTASFTELKLRHFNAGPSALLALVMWPAKLTSFQFTVPLSNHYSLQAPVMAYDLGIMQPILSHQKDSLTYIRMDQLLQPGLYNFNMTEFRSLKVLWLALDVTGTDPESVANLLAPNLEVFHWNLMLEDQKNRVSLDSFEKREEDWLRAFASAAIARNSTLRHIEIRFSPEEYIMREEKTGLEYPWDRMDRIASDIQPHGIYLSYSPITVSRGTFNFLAKAPTHVESMLWRKGLPLPDTTTRWTRARSL